MRFRMTYFFCVWMATFSMLLSTVMLHHHHFNKICFVEERCDIDGNLNDEHTEHHENEREGCEVHQMHHFIINAKIVSFIQKHVLDGGNLLMALLPSSFTLPQTIGVSLTKWQEKAEPLLSLSRNLNGRRGPPCFL